jgi:hypothetical protein
MELLGPSLADLLMACGGHFSMRTVAMIAQQLVRGLDVTLCSLIPSMTFGGYRMFVFSDANGVLCKLLSSKIVK